ncbi:GFA family protein [Paraburkholderia sediminicola]|uniref:GFA family protein n=1 Tax=Paraburkholderia sediminicola TaxID=458836 RepID=UPI0038B818F1
MAKITGGCLCGAVRYESDGTPLMSLRCHCRDCQYLSGGEPADALVVPAASLKRIKGEERVYWTEANSGTPVFRSFCEVCGTPLYAGNSAHTDAIAIKLGSLDEPALYPPTGHIWTSSAQLWHYIDPAQVAFERNPPD